METQQTIEYSPGQYGDLGGVVFYGPPQDGFWSTKLEVSVRYSDRIFGAIHALARENKRPMNRFVRDWANMEGWWEGQEPTPLATDLIRDLMEALSHLTAKDVDTDGPEPETLIECAKVIRNFLAERLNSGDQIYVDSR